jgi:peptidoglycan/LPS O-acetylase OafA/YrhL
VCGLGQISYGLYFSHNLVLILLDNGAKALGLGYPAWLQAVVLALSVGMAGLSWAKIERPVLALKDWLPYEREPAQGREAVPALEASRT